jgi:hypothetical protein
VIVRDNERRSDLLAESGPDGEAARRGVDGADGGNGRGTSKGGNCAMERQVRPSVELMEDDCAVGEPDDGGHAGRRGRHIYGTNTSHKGGVVNDTQDLGDGDISDYEKGPTARKNDVELWKGGKPV